MSIEIDWNAEVRKKLDRIADKGGIQKLVENLPSEIILIKAPFPDMDCEEYALGTSGKRSYLPYLFPNINDPQPEDIVLYHKMGQGIVHVGRYKINGFVESKWSTDGPVLKHPIDMVPWSYGESYILRRIPEHKLKMLRGSDADYIIMQALGMASGFE